MTHGDVPKYVITTCGSCLQWEISPKTQTFGPFAETPAAMCWRYLNHQGAGIKERLSSWHRNHLARAQPPKTKYTQKPIKSSATKCTRPATTWLPLTNAMLRRCLHSGWDANSLGRNQGSRTLKDLIENGKFKILLCASMPHTHYLWYLWYLEHSAQKCNCGLIHN